MMRPAPNLPGVVDFTCNAMGVSRHGATSAHASAGSSSSAHRLLEVKPITFRPRGQKSTIGCTTYPAPRVPGGARRASTPPRGLPSPRMPRLRPAGTPRAAPSRPSGAVAIPDYCNLSHLFGHRRGNSRGPGRRPPPGGAPGRRPTPFPAKRLAPPRYRGDRIPAPGGGRPRRRALASRAPRPACSCPRARVQPTRFQDEPRCRGTSRTARRGMGRSFPPLCRRRYLIFFTSLPQNSATHARCTKSDCMLLKS